MDALLGGGCAVQQTNHLSNLWWEQGANAVAVQQLSPPSMTDRLREHARCRAEDCLLATVVHPLVHFQRLGLCVCVGHDGHERTTPATTQVS
jgi:hypothetical protein